MSLIKKIVELAERSDTKDAKKYIAKLNKDIKSHKEKVRSLMESNYVDFLPEVYSCESLLEEGAYLDKEMKDFDEYLNIEKHSMFLANEEMSKLVDEFQETKASLIVGLKLVKIDSLMNKIKLFNESHNYKEINETINKIQLLLGDPDDQIIRRLDIYKNLRLRLVLERQNMIQNLDMQFNGLVQMKQKSFPKTRSITMIISKDARAITDCVNSLIECDFNFQMTIEFLKKNVFEPTMCRAVLLDIKDGNDKEATMTLSYSTETINDELRPNYETVFLNIRTILFFLHKMNVTVSDGKHILARIFKNEKKEIFDLIFNECLMFNIPKTYEEKTKSTIDADVEKLSKNFAELHFFESSDDKEKNLESYCKKIDDLFFQQFTKNVQSSASEILKRDLHDMILITNDASLSTTTPLTFPKSMVSKSTLELIKLLDKIIHQAVACNAEDSLKRKNLMESVKIVLENYAYTIQLHHSQLLSKIPQQSALFYNNCMYLCHWISLNDADFEDCNIDSAIYELKRQGEDFFECQVAKQKIQILEVLKEFDPYQSLNTFLPEHFKPVRQCLRQLDLLKNVWQTILPTELYNKTLGDLLDVIDLDIIKKVTSMEDISTTLANGLVDLIKTVDEKGQSLFLADCSALDVVDNWQKLLHLQFILDASLVDIQASWKNGQISISFTADEVKRLIRALFQNTERRANCLQAIA